MSLASPSTLALPWTLAPTFTLPLCLLLNPSSDSSSISQGRVYFFRDGSEWWIRTSLKFTNGRGLRVWLTSSVITYSIFSYNTPTCGLYSIELRKKALLDLLKKAKGLFLMSMKYDTKSRNLWNDRIKKAKLVTFSYFWYWGTQDLVRDTHILFQLQSTSLINWSLEMEVTSSCWHWWWCGCGCMHIYVFVCV